MNDQRSPDPDGLIDEITRYLAAVDVFRAESREPIWRPELVPEVARPTAAVAPQLLAADIGPH